MLYTMKNLKALGEALDRDETAEVDREVYIWYLEVLPPAFQPYKAKFKDNSERDCSFGFAEGRMLIIAFWKENKRYYCRQSVRMNPWT